MEQKSCNDQRSLSHRRYVRSRLVVAKHVGTNSLSVKRNVTKTDRYFSNFICITILMSRTMLDTLGSKLNTLHTFDTKHNKVPQSTQTVCDSEHLPRKCVSAVHDIFIYFVILSQLKMLERAADNPILNFEKRKRIRNRGL